jgi:hypothetical protein
MTTTIVGGRAKTGNDPALIQLGQVLPGATRIIGLGGNETYRGVVETGGLAAWALLVIDQGKTHVFAPSL